MADIFELMSSVTKGVEKLCGPECFDIIDQERLYSRVESMLNDGTRDDQIIEFLTSELIIFVGSQRAECTNFTEVDEADILKSINFSTENSVTDKVTENVTPRQERDSNVEMPPEEGRDDIPIAEPTSYSAMEHMQRSGAIPKRPHKREFEDAGAKSALSVYTSHRTGTTSKTSSLGPQRDGENEVMNERSSSSVTEIEGTSETILDLGIDPTASDGSAPISLESDTRNQLTTSTADCPLGTFDVKDVDTSRRQQVTSSCAQNSRPSTFHRPSSIDDNVASHANNNTGSDISKSSGDIDMDSGLGTANNSEEALDYDPENSMLCDSELLSELPNDVDSVAAKNDTPHNGMDELEHMKNSDQSDLSNSDAKFGYDTSYFSDEDESKKDVDEISQSSTAEMDTIENLDTELDNDCDFQAVVPHKSDLDRAEDLFERPQVSNLASVEENSTGFGKKEFQFARPDVQRSIEKNLRADEAVPGGSDASTGTGDISGGIDKAAGNISGDADARKTLRLEGETALASEAMDFSHADTPSTTLSSGAQHQHEALGISTENGSKNSCTIHASRQKQWQFATKNCSNQMPDSCNSVLNRDEWLAAHCVLLFDLFPDAETGYLIYRCQEIIGNERRFTALIEELSTAENVPLNEEAARRVMQNGSPPSSTLAPATTSSGHTSPTGVAGPSHSIPQASASAPHPANDHLITIKDLASSSNGCRSELLSTSDQEELDAVIAHQMEFEDTPDHTEQDVLMAHQLEMEEMDAAAQRAAELVPNTLQCCCCIMDKPLIEMLPCGEEEKAPHFACSECLKRYMEEFIGSNKLTFPCLEGSCTSHFPDYVVKNVLGPAMHLRLQQRRQAEEVEAANLDNLERCPFCNYAAIIEEKVTVRSKTNLVFSCRNQECGKRSCRLCQKEDHSPNLCEEADDQKNARTVLENAMSEAMVRPKQRALEKNNNKKKQAVKSSPELQMLRVILKRGVPLIVAMVMARFFGNGVANFSRELVGGLIDPVMDYVENCVDSRKQDQNSDDDND